MFATDWFEFWICSRGTKNKIYVFFYSGLFSYLGGESNPQNYKIFGCSSPINLEFWIGSRGPKIRNTYLFILACLDV